MSGSYLSLLILHQQSFTDSGRQNAGIHMNLSNEDQENAKQVTRFL